MLIYQDTTERFVSQVRENRVSDIVGENFRQRFGRKASPNEWNSWQNSLPRVRDLIELASLSDNMIALEYEVPYNQSRLDCLLFGKSASGTPGLMVIELKQWSAVKSTTDEGNFVETFVGQAERVVPHPSQQVKGYTKYLKNFVAEFEGANPLILDSCAYCHNYTRVDGEGLFDPTYKELIAEYPIYTKDDALALAELIKRILSKGDGLEVFNRFMQSPIRPSNKLLDSVHDVITNGAEFALLNEQLVAKNLIWSKVRRASKQKERSVIIVHGGPGTGKSVIALNLLAQAAGKKMKVFFGCKSKSFVEGLKNRVGGDGTMLFSNLIRFIPSKRKVDAIDLLLVDEAHRIEKTSNFQFTKPEDRTDMPQVDQLVRCSKTAVFFIDDRQNVRSSEIGSSQLIREAATRHNRQVAEVTLETQFRCMGSNDYLLWLESALGYSKEKRTLRKDEKFDFRMFDSPQQIYDIICQKDKEKPNSARMVAGFCWPWSKQLDDNGQLPKDVVVGDFAMPWETHEAIRAPRGYVKWFEWAYKPEGVKQIGCIYTAQGFEFEYVGVIVGNDLIYDAKSDCLVTDINATADPALKRNSAAFDTHARNIYRTLLSRGMRGCYVYFTNKGTEKYFRDRMEAHRS